MNQTLPALGKRKHFHSCQVEDGIAHSHPVSSKTGLENQRKYEYIYMHSSFTITRNDSNLKPLFKTSSNVTLGITISIASLLCAVEQTAELDSQWNVLPEASDSRLSLLFRGNGFMEAVLHPRWGKRNSGSYFKCTQRLLGTFTVISWTVMLHLVSETANYA